jgi:micrococcal nuclease
MPSAGPLSWTNQPNSEIAVRKKWCQSVSKKTIYAMSRQKRIVLLALSVLLIVVLVWVDHSTAEYRFQHRTKSEKRALARDFEKYHGKTFTVVKVVDGDTIDINIPDGEYKHTRIRLWGIDAPEIEEPNTPPAYFGPEAAEFAKKLSYKKNVTIYLDENNDTRDKYGRLLAYVKLPDGRFLNEVTLSEGYAYADWRFHHSLYHKYKQLEAAARRQKKGLWLNVTLEQMPEWRQDRIKNQNANIKNTD